MGLRTWQQYKAIMAAKCKSPPEAGPSESSKNESLDPAMNKAYVLAFMSGSQLNLESSLSRIVLSAHKDVLDISKEFLKHLTSSVPESVASRRHPMQNQVSFIFQLNPAMLKAYVQIVLAIQNFIQLVLKSSQSRFFSSLPTASGASHKRRRRGQNSSVVESIEPAMIKTATDIFQTIVKILDLLNNCAAGETQRSLAATAPEFWLEFFQNVENSQFWKIITGHDSSL